MNFPYNYAIIGGDSRQIYLAGELARSENRVCHYALCKSPNKAPYSDTRGDSAPITAACSLEEACGSSACIVCPIPLSKNGPFLNQSAFSENLPLSLILSALKPGQTFFAGCIPEIFRSAAADLGVQVFDLMDVPSLSFYNTIATAEGAVCEALIRSPLNLHQSSCAVLGYGKCGHTITNYLKGMFCRVCVVSSQETERAQAALIADQTEDLKGFEACAGNFDFIFNTIPAPVVTARVLERMRRSVTIIDIASAPGGVDFQAAQNLGICAALCPGLPGKYAPASSAKAIKEIIEKNLKEY